jgi:hypothetical protein
VPASAVVLDAPPIIPIAAGLDDVRPQSYGHLRTLRTLGTKSVVRRDVGGVSKVIRYTLHPLDDILLFHTPNLGSMSRTSSHRTNSLALAMRPQ